MNHPSPGPIEEEVGSSSASLDCYIGISRGIIDREEGGRRIAVGIGEEEDEEDEQ